MQQLMKQNNLQREASHSVKHMYKTESSYVEEARQISLRETSPLYTLGLFIATNLIIEYG